MAEVISTVKSTWLELTVEITSAAGCTKPKEMMTGEMNLVFWGCFLEYSLSPREAPLGTNGMQTRLKPNKGFGFIHVGRHIEDHVAFGHHQI